MKCRYIEEPELKFGIDKHIDIKFGIMNFGVLDFEDEKSPRQIKLGIIGKNEDIDLFLQWLEKGYSEIPAKESNKRNLFPRFVGFNEEGGFYSKIITNSTFHRQLSQQDIKEISQIKETEVKISEAVGLFVTEIQYLAETKHQIDVIVCAVPIEFASKMHYSEEIESEDEDIENEYNTFKRVIDFRRLLKAKSLRYRIPIQIILPHTYNEKVKKRVKIRPNSEGTLQDNATRAWNFFTALYYKSGGTPWRIIRKSDDLQTCHIGISFYRSLDEEHVHTSTAQVFNERGEGVIIRGGEAFHSKDDLQIHLSADEAEKLVDKSLNKYRQEHFTQPARVSIHKSSLFNQDEIDGLISGLRKHNIQLFDFISFSKSQLRLHRDGKYPPLRGTLWEIDDETKILYTKGSADFFQTYAGLYIPKSLMFKIAYTEQSTFFLAKEILTLTKMNWNNTQFDNSLPITIKAARQVGDILKYIETDEYESNYCFYM